MAIELSQRRHDLKANKEIAGKMTLIRNLRLIGTVMIIVSAALGASPFRLAGTSLLLCLL